MGYDDTGSARPDKPTQPAGLTAHDAWGKPPKCDEDNCKPGQGSRPDWGKQPPPPKPEPVINNNPSNTVIDNNAPKTTITNNDHPTNTFNPTNTFKPTDTNTNNNANNNRNNNTNDNTNNNRNNNTNDNANNNRNNNNNNAEAQAQASARTGSISNRQTYLSGIGSVAGTPIYGNDCSEGNSYAVNAFFAGGSVAHLKTNLECKMITAKVEDHRINCDAMLKSAQLAVGSLDAASDNYGKGNNPGAVQVGNAQAVLAGKLAEVSMEAVKACLPPESQTPVEGIPAVFVNPNPPRVEAPPPPAPPAPEATPVPVAPRPTVIHHKPAPKVDNCDKDNVKK